MNHIFQKSGSNWIYYDKYQWQTDKKGVLYLTPTDDVTPKLYNPLKDADQMVLSAINLGLLCIKGETSLEVIKSEIMSFVCQYGLLGFMTALPTTPEFITYEAVYLPKNHFI